MTAVPKRLLKALDERDGHVCAWHGETCGGEVLVPQHRANRGMGGRPSGDRIENLVWLCSFINYRIEVDADLAEQAIRDGIKLRSWEKPIERPVRYSDGRTFYLLANGRRTEWNEVEF